MCICFFFFKQKTAYEMRISDWSSDVCSSDLLSRFMGGRFVHLKEIGAAMDEVRKAGKPVLTFANAYLDDGVQLAAHSSEAWLDPMEIGRASCRERVCQYV